MRKILFIIAVFIAEVSLGQSNALKLNLDEDGTTYIKGSVRTMFWARYMDMNPGTTINNELVNNDVDFSIRRLRIAIQSQITPKLYFYSLMGGNNINSRSEKDWKMGVLDLNVEYEFAEEFSLGIGKHAWDGLSRNLVRSSASLMALDAPLFSLLSVNMNDDVGRGFGIWSKGQIGKFDYILSLKKPTPYGVAAQEGVTGYALNSPKLRSSAYVKYEFLDNESNKTAYSGGAGTYLGKKKILNLGAGYLFEPEMTSRLVNNEEVYYDFKNWAVEIFYDTPLNTDKATALTCYLGYFNTDFGLDYIRNVGANGYTSGGTSFNGSGTAFPMMGTGDIVFFQFGYLLPKDLLGKKKFNGQLQPNIAIQQSYFDALDDAATVVDLGVNWYFKGHTNKLTLGYQSRPIFNENTLGEIKETDRKGMFALQYQIVIN
ncbi:porin [Neptunitalea lumnitzerae]|nr:porin [Neptunitalea sp. Y10]